MPSRPATCATPSKPDSVIACGPALSPGKSTARLAEQVADAVGAAQQVDDLPSHDDVENVVVLGMGDSGIVGDLLTAVAAPFMPVPVTVVKGYVPPDYVGTESLVIAVSFSGDTEETIEAATAAYEAGAAMVVVSGGGELVRLSGEWDVPLVPVPVSIPEARTALGAMAIPPLVLLERIGLFPGAQQWIDQAVDQLQIRGLAAQPRPVIDDFELHFLLFEIYKSHSVPTLFACPRHARPAATHGSAVCLIIMTVKTRHYPCQSGHNYCRLNWYNTC